MDTKFELYQFRDTLGQKDKGTLLATANGFRKIRGEAKAQFFSHLDMVARHDYFGYDDWEVDEKNFILRAIKDEVIVYEYRLEIISDFIGAPTCSVCGAEVPYFDEVQETLAL